MAAPIPPYKILREKCLQFNPKIPLTENYFLEWSKIACENP